MVVAAIRKHLFAADGPYRRDQIGRMPGVRPHRRTSPSHCRRSPPTQCGQRRQARDRVHDDSLLCPTLVDAGHTELATTCSSAPTFRHGCTRSQGATTVWETWDAIKPDGSVSDVSKTTTHSARSESSCTATLRDSTQTPSGPATTRPYRTPTDPAGRLTARANLETARGPCRPAGPSATGSSLSTPPSRWGPPQRSPSAPHRPTSAPEPPGVGTASRVIAHRLADAAVTATKAPA